MAARDKASENRRSASMSEHEHQGLELPNGLFEPLSDQPKAKAAERPKPSLWLKVERLPGDGGRARVYVERGAFSHVDQLSLKSERQREMFAEACERKQPGCYDEILTRLERESRQASSKYDARHDDACQFVFTGADKFLPEPVDWLWEKYIPAGAVTILEGDPGVGKSMILADLAARVSRGFLAPDRNPAFDEPGHDPDVMPERVWWFAGQDRISQTLTPRLRAAGADLPMIKIVEGTEDRKTQKCRSVAFPQDFNSLWNSQSAAPRLVIVDPLSSFCGGSLNHQTALKAIAELSKFAAETGAAVVVVRSLNRRLGATASQRGSAGPTLTAEARSALLLAQHPEDPTKQVLAVVKSNLCAKASSLELRVLDSSSPSDLKNIVAFRSANGFASSANDLRGDAELLDGGKESFRGAKGDDLLANDSPSAPVVAWLGKSTFEADELLQPTRTGRAQPSPFEQKKVEEWLNQKLAKGPKLQAEIDEQAKLDEVPPVLLRRAKISLNIHAVGRNGSTTWSLPSISIEPSTNDEAKDSSPLVGEVARTPTAGEPVGGANANGDANPTPHPARRNVEPTSPTRGEVRNGGRRHGRRSKMCRSDKSWHAQAKRGRVRTPTNH
jgi:hypothetical protein